MLLGVANASVAGEQREKQLMGTAVERRQLEPFVQVREGFFVGQAAGELLQQRQVMATHPAPLRREPVGDGRAAIDLEAVEKVSGEQGGQLSQLLWCHRREARTRGPSDFLRLDEAVRQVQAQGVGCESTRLRSGSSIRRLILLRHQRSSPRGSSGPSHSSSQSWPRVTGCGATAR